MTRRVSPQDTEPTNQKVSKIDMCIYVLGALSGEITTVYWAVKGCHFHISLKLLRDNLELIEASVKFNSEKRERLNSKDDLSGNETTRSPRTDRGPGSATKMNAISHKKED